MYLHRFADPYHALITHELLPCQLQIFCSTFLPLTSDSARSLPNIWSQDYSSKAFPMLDSHPQVSLHHNSNVPLGLLLNLGSCSHSSARPWLSRVEPSFLSSIGITDSTPQTSACHVHSHILMYQTILPIAKFLFLGGSGGWLCPLWTWRNGNLVGVILLTNYNAFPRTRPLPI